MRPVGEGWRDANWWEEFRRKLPERFWKRVKKTKDCWEWQGMKKKDGLPYGLVKIFFRRFYAHRVAWELTNGPIPKGLNVLHRCDNPVCVRPSHLFLGTQADNIADMVSKGRNRSPLERWRR